MIGELEVSVKIPAMPQCAFCDYLAGARPYTVLLRDASVAVLVTREQRGVGHLLVLPIQHCATLLHLSDAQCAACMVMVRNCARVIDEVYSRPGISVWQNNGVSANQTVPHFHFHVAGTVEAGGTLWGDVPVLSVQQTNKIGERMRASLLRHAGKSS